MDDDKREEVSTTKSEIESDKINSFSSEEDDYIVDDNDVGSYDDEE